ncbi:hypothetical protein D3C83_34540 [compost metagenome]
MTTHQPGGALAPSPALVEGWRCDNAVITLVSWACACSRVEPFASRPTTAMMCESRTAVISPGKGKLRGMPRSPVIQTSPPATICMSNDPGSTPTIVCGTLLRIIVLPSASADPP